MFTTEQVSLGVGNSFSTYFQFQITAPGGIGDGDGTGADGLVFVVQTQNNNVGAAGEGIGYTGIAPSVGVEFDTFDNGFSRGDPDGNHVGINVNGTVASVVLTTEPTRFNDADVWNAWVDYNSATAELEVRWALGITRPDNAQLSYTLNLASLLGQDTAFVGFTSATGAGYGNHVILAWEYRGDFAPIVVPEPSGIALLAGSALVMFARPMRRKTETERGRGPCNDPVVFTT